MKLLLGVLTIVFILIFIQNRRKISYVLSQDILGTEKVDELYENGGETKAIQHTDLYQGVKPEEKEEDNKILLNKTTSKKFFDNPMNPEAFFSTLEHKELEGVVQ